MKYTTLKTLAIFGLFFMLAAASVHDGLGWPTLSSVDCARAHERAVEGG